jgi:parallel beta-helix repeat protein
LVVDSNAGTLTSNLSALNGGIYYNSSTNHLNIIENGAVKEVCNKTDLGCGSSSTSQTKVVAMGSPAGCTGSSPVASADTNADYVVNSCTSAQTTINTAITAVNTAGGGTVYLKEGTYIIDGTINMASNVTLAGAGAGTTLKLKDSINAGIDLITLSGINRVTVKDIRLDGNRTNNTSGTQNAFNISSVGSGTGTSAVPGLSATDITVQNFRSDAFSISSITNSVISNSSLINNGSRGIEFKFSGGTNDSYLRINGNTIQGSGDRGIWGDITGNPSYVTIDDNIIESNTGAGVYLSGNNNTISGNVFRSNGNKGIQLFGSNNTVSSNNFVSNTGSGVYVRGGGNAISSNTMTSNTGNGVEIDSASSGQNAVTGNKINSNGSSGIYAGGSNNSITGNDVMSNTGHGIEVVSSSNNVTGNAVASNTSDGIHIGCCSNVNNIVSGNQVSSNSGTGITVDASDTTKIDGNWIYNNGGSGSTSSILVFANAFHTPDKNIITNNTIVDTAGTGYAIELSGGAKAHQYLYIW